MMDKININDLIESCYSSGDIDKRKLSLDLKSEDVTLNNNEHGKKDELSQRAAWRVSNIEMRNQENIENVLELTKSTLNAENFDYSDTKMDSDWYYRFIENTKGISNKDMQMIFAQVLAGEIKTPNSISLQALDILKTMSNLDAQIFKKVSEYAIAYRSNEGSNVFIPQYGMYFDINEDHRDEFYGLNFDDLSALSELRLITTQTDTEIRFTSNDLENNLELKSGNIGIVIKSSLKEICIPAYLYTRAGLQLYSFFKDLQGNKLFLQDRIINKLKNKETQVNWGEYVEDSGHIKIINNYE